MSVKTNAKQLLAKTVKIQESLETMNIDEIARKDLDYTYSAAVGACDELVTALTDLSNGK